MEVLHPYLAYINQTFAKGSVYSLSNIYVLQAIKDCEKLNIALAKRNDSKDLTPLLIICLKPNMQQENIDTYSIKQPSNTFLSIVAFEGVKLDIGKIDTKKI